MKVNCLNNNLFHPLMLKRLKCLFFFIRIRTGNEWCFFVFLSVCVIIVSCSFYQNVWYCLFIIRNCKILMKKYSPYSLEWNPDTMQRMRLVAKPSLHCCWARRTYWKFSHTDSMTIQYFLFTRGKLGVPHRVPASVVEPCGGNYKQNIQATIYFKNINS